ncbi:hypothetical protein JYK22_29885, partial [Nonomuraea sp. RK-328]|nr:hypothetical protein [Nonomuraea sp. RK-328]
MLAGLWLAGPMNKIAWIVGRGALVGLVVGLALAAVFFKVYVGHEDDLSQDVDLTLVVLGSFPFGATLALAARLPFWWLLGMTGPIAAAILWMPAAALFGFFGSSEAVSLVPSGVLGYAAMTWVVSTTASWRSKLVVIGLIVTAYVLPWVPWSTAFLF